MQTFILICHDKPGAVATRMAARPDHLAYLKESGVKLWLGGPMLNEKEEPVGSVLIIDAVSETAAQAFADGDPYANAGLFESVEIRPYKFVAGEFLSSGND